MIVLDNHLPADDSHEKSCLIVIFGKKNDKICNCRLLQIIGGALWLNSMLTLLAGLEVYIFCKILSNLILYFVYDASSKGYGDAAHMTL